MQVHARVSRLAGAALLVVVCLVATRSDGSPGPKGKNAQPAATEEPSYYLRDLRKGGLDIKAMSPLVLSPRPDDRMSYDAPDT